MSKTNVSPEFDALIKIELRLDDAAREMGPARSRPVRQQADAAFAALGDINRIMADWHKVKEAEIIAIDRAMRDVACRLGKTPQGKEGVADG